MGYDRFTLGEYATNPTITIGMDYRTKELTMTDPSTGKEVTVRVDVWDTAGMERYRSSVKVHDVFLDCRDLRELTAAWCPISPCIEAKTVSLSHMTSQKQDPLKRCKP